MSSVLFSETSGKINCDVGNDEDADDDVVDENDDPKSANADVVAKKDEVVVAVETDEGIVVVAAGVAAVGDFDVVDAATAIAGVVKTIWLMSIGFCVDVVTGLQTLQTRQEINKFPEE